MRCPEDELLSCYLDGELSVFKGRWLETHLGRCPRCLRSIRLLSAMKARLAGLAVPEMPRDVRQTIENIVSAQILDTSSVESSVRRGFFVQASAWSVWALVMAACVFWLKTDHEPSRQIPMEWLLAEYRRDAAQLPLAEAERMVLDDPREEVRNGF